MATQHKRSKSKESGKNDKFLTDFGQAIAELNDVLAGKRQAQDAYDLLDTLDCIARHNEPVRPFSEVMKEILTSRRA